MAIKITFRSHKGGVAKTTLTYNAATYLTLKGFKVLCVDTDPQGSLTDVLTHKWTKKLVDGKLQWFGEPCVDIKGISTKSLFEGKPDGDEILTSSHGIDLIYMLPNNFQAGVMMSNTENCARFLSSINKLIGDYDFVFFDLPPTVTTYVISILTDVDYFVVPQTVAANLVAASGEYKIINSISRTQNLLGVVINKMDQYSREHVRAEEILREKLGNEIFSSTIHQSSAIDTSLARNIPLNKVPGGAKAYKEMQNVFEEMLARIYIKQALALKNGTFTGTPKEKQRVIDYIKAHSAKK